MAKKITSKGKMWELLNSIWMLWSIVTFGFLNYISFYYIAYRVKQKKWTIWGIIYSIPFILYILTYETINSDSVLSNIIFGIVMISWIGSIFHVFRIRAEYLLRLEQQKQISNREIEQLRKSIQNEYHGKNQPISSLKSKEFVPHWSIQEREKNLISSSIIPIDINTGSEEEIGSIPSIGIILAKKIIALRKEKGGFASIDDFADSLQLKPHVRERIKPYVQFSDIGNNASIKSEEKSGRIVDF